MRRKLLTCFLVFFLPFLSVLSQVPDLKTTFLEAESYFLFEEYNEALPLYLKIHRADPDNDDINYKIGICLLNDPFQKERAIDYLEKASKNVNPKYKENNFKETTAPLETFFYLGNAYLINDELEKARENYLYFREILDEDVYDINLVDQQIRICERAGDLKQKPVDFDLINLGEIINGRFSDINPVLSGDGEHLIYVSQRQFYDATFYSKKVDGIWQTPRNIIPELGVDGDVYPTCLSHDGKTMIIYRNDDFIGNLYVSYLRDGIWSAMEKLGDNINTKYWESHGTLSRDGKTLYFTSNRKGGFGGLDIYKSALQEDGTWGKPENLGETINSRYNEETPFITEDGKRIYFSSYGHYNMGGYDIFYSQVNENGEWGTPINLGYPINTTDDDLFFMPFNNGNSGLISKITNEGFGGYDIYYMEIYSENNPRLYLVKGRFSTDKGAVSPDDEVGIYLVDPVEGDTLLRKIPDFDSQSFEMKVPKGDFNLIIDSKTFKEIVSQISVNDSTNKDGIDISEVLQLEQNVVLPKLLTGQESRIGIAEDTIAEVPPGKEYTLRLDLKRNSKLFVDVYYDSLLMSSDTFDISRRRFKYSLIPGDQKTMIDFVMEEENGDRSKSSILLLADTTRKEKTVKQAFDDSVLMKDTISESPETDTEQFVELPGSQNDKENEEAYERVRSLIADYQKYASGALSEILMAIDPAKEGIKNSADLKEYLINEFGIDEAEISAIELIISLDNNAEDMLLYMIDNSDGKLKAYLENLDLEKLGIDSADELIAHLKQVAGNEGFSVEDVFNMIGAMELEGITAEMARKELLIVADGELKTYLKKLDLQKKNIRSVSDLIGHLRSVSGEEAFTREEVERLIIKESYKDVLAEEILKDFILLSDGDLQEYLQNLDLEKQHIQSALDLINHLNEVAGKGSFTRAEINSLVTPDMMVGLTALELRNFLMSLGSDGLVIYLQSLDFEKEGIYTSAELIDHLRRMAGEESFSLQEVENLISDQLVSALTAEELKLYLMQSGSAELFSYLEGLDLNKEEIASATELSAYLRKIAVEGGSFNLKNINQLLLAEQYKDISADELRSNLQEIATGALRKYLEEIDFDEHGIISGADLIQHLLKVAGDQPFSNSDISFLLTNVSVKDLTAEEVMDFIGAIATGKLKNYVENLDLKQKKLTGPVELINHLREVSDHEGFEADEINRVVAIAKLESMNADDALKRLMEFASEDLKDYLSNLNLAEKGIENGGELINYLLEISKRQEFSIQDINTLIEVIHKNEFSAENARLILMENADGKLKHYLINLDLASAGINTKQDLLNHLISRVDIDFSAIDLYEALPSLFGENRSLESFMEYLLSVAPLKLGKFLSELNLEKEGIKTIDDLFYYLLQHADEAGMKQASLIKFMIDSAAEFLSNPTDGDGIHLHYERQLKGLRIMGVVFLTGILFIIIFFLRRKKKNEKDQST